MRRNVLCTSLLLLFCSALAGAQPKPDFGGTWAVVRLPEWMKRFGAAEVDVELTIKQSGLMISSSQRITSKSTGRPNQPDFGPHVLYLDGQERRRKQIDGAIEVTRTFWDGQVLVTTVVRKSKDGRTTSTSTRKWSIGLDGLLVIEALEDGSSRQPARDVMTLKRK